MRLALLLLLAAVASAGEYEPPIPRPDARRPTITPGADATPGPTDPGPVPPHALPPPPAPRTGFVRVDTRLTVRVWWETNRHRFLPPPPELPHRNELIELLLGAARAGASPVRDRALLSLGRAGAMRAFSRFREKAGAESAELSVSAILGLGLLGDDSASPILRKIALDPKSPVCDRAFALLSLGLLTCKEDTRFLREAVAAEWQGDVRAAAILGVGLHRDTESTNLLGRLLLGVEPPERSPAEADGGAACALPGLSACALGEILTPACYDYLVQALDRGEPAVRAAAALVLAEARGTVGVPALRRALAERLPLQVRQRALLSGEPALPAARAVLESPAERDGGLGAFAALVLARTGDLTVLDLDGVPAETLAGAALGLGLGGDERHAERLEKLLAGEDADLVGLTLVADAMLGGKKAGPFALRVLRESAVPSLRRDAATALGLLGAKEAVTLLAAALSEAGPVAAEAARSLARIDAATAAAELAKRLADPDPDVARSAAFVLGELLDRRRPGRLAGLVSRMNLLCDANLAKAIVWETNPHLFRLVWE